MVKPHQTHLITWSLAARSGGQLRQTAMMPAAAIWLCPHECLQESSRSRGTSLPGRPNNSRAVGPMWANSLCNQLTNQPPLQNYQQTHSSLLRRRRCRTSGASHEGGQRCLASCASRASQLARQTSNTQLTNKPVCTSGADAPLTNGGAARCLCRRRLAIKTTKQHHQHVINKPTRRPTNRPMPHSLQHAPPKPQAPLQRDSWRG